MQNKYLIHSQIRKASFLMLCMLVFSIGKADITQTLTKLTLQNIKSGAGDTSPVMVYNPIKNEYFVVYADFDATCSTKQKLYGISINAITGLPIGSSFPITTCNKKAVDPQVVYNSKQNEYAIAYKSIESAGAKILVQIIDASNNSLKQSIEMASISLGDPYENTALLFSPSTDIYSVGYHEIINATDIKLKIKYINSITKAITGYTSLIDKNTFTSQNDGVKHTKFLSANGNIFICFELNLIDGSEIWGGFFNPVSGQINNSYFQISPTPTSDTVYLNPSTALNSLTNEILVVYEKSHLQISTAALNQKIRAQKINGSTGVRIAPINRPITNLPAGVNPNEDSKVPTVVYSSRSNEFLVFFYGEKWINADNNFYDTYVQRLSANDLAPINSESILVKADIGTSISQNNALRKLGITFNSTNNQFLFGWNMLSGTDIQTQIWRYDNNTPGNLSAATTVQNENIALGSTFTTLSATDPDPEDTSPTFTFVSGTGGEDNNFFTLTGNTLKVAKKLNFEESNTRKIKIRATDSHGGSTELAFILNINNLNENPFNLALSGLLSVNENLTPGSFTSNCTVKDDDIGDVHTFTLVAGDSSVNNSNFIIEQGSNVLKLINGLNYETSPKQFVRIRATDKTGLTVEKAFVIQVIDLNEPPEGIELLPGSLPENDPESMAVVNVIDPDINSNYLVVWTSGDGDDDNGLFKLQDNQLKPTSALNFETRSSYSVRVKASDGIFETTKAFEITVADINDKPDSVRLSEKRIETEKPAGSIVGQLITYDQDAGDTHIYQLIEGTDHFFINGSDLRILSPLNYDSSIPSNNFYTIKVRATDSQGTIKEETLRIEVVLFKDDEKPEILYFNKNPANISSETLSFDLSVNAKDNEKLDTAFFYYRPIRSNGDFTNATNLIQTKKLDAKLYQLDVSLMTSLMDEMGISYYFKVRDAAGNLETTDIGYCYWIYSKKTFEPTAETFNGTVESYKIITNPYALESTKVSKIFADYGSSDADAWRLFSFENQQLTELGNVSGAYMKQGKGYWFNKVSILDEAIEFENASIPRNNQNNLFIIKLEKGWNMIGNPYPFEIRMEDVLLENNLSNNELILYTYNQTYHESTKLNAFEGGFVYADGPMDLKIPLDKSDMSDGRIAQNNEFENGWMVKFALDNGRLKNEFGGLGMNLLADDSFDTFDRPLLPRFINHLDMYFSHPEHFSQAFARDIVELKESHIWEFVASTNFESNKAILSWDSQGIQKFPNQLLLYDVANDKIIDMKLTSEYVFVLDRPSVYKVIYGNELFVKDTLAKIKTAALTPYPNPFNSLISFPINLPSSTGKYNLECSIYNLMGNKIFERKIENIESGLFQLDWEEGRDTNIEQGIYLYTIKVMNGFLINNFQGRIVKN